MKISVAQALRPFFRVKKSNLETLPDDNLDVFES